MDEPYGGTKEEPAWDSKGLLLTHIPASMIIRFDPGFGTSNILRANTNNANDLMFDTSGHCADSWQVHHDRNAAVQHSLGCPRPPYHNAFVPDEKPSPQGCIFAVQDGIVLSA